MHVRIVGNNGIGDFLQQHRLAGLGRRDDERALAKAYGRDKIDDAQRQVPPVGAVFQGAPFVRIDGRQLFKSPPLHRLFRGIAVDFVNVQQRAVSVAFARRTRFCP